MRGKTWNFIRPRRADRVVRFEPTGEAFGAMYGAQRWLRDHGYRYGSSDWSHYIPAMQGERYTLPQRLYNFDEEDVRQVSAVMYSLDYREGWVEVWLTRWERVLHLVLRHQWYDMILRGEKREEYRDPARWRKVLTGGYTLVCFHRGYTDTTMVKRIEGTALGTGRTEWGAEAGRQYVVIRLSDDV